MMKKTYKMRYRAQVEYIFRLKTKKSENQQQKMFKPITSFMNFNFNNDNKSHTKK